MFGAIVAGSITNGRLTEVGGSNNRAMCGGTGCIAMGAGMFIFELNETRVDTVQMQNHTCDCVGQASFCAAGSMSPWVAYNSQMKGVNVSSSAIGCKGLDCGAWGWLVSSGAKLEFACLQCASKQSR